jgi:hypothetical protein
MFACLLFIVAGEPVGTQDGDAPENVLGNGDFEAIHGDRPADWKLTAATEVVEEDGNHYLTIEPEAGHLNWAEQVIDLDPTWKRLELSARMRAEGLVTGEKHWQTLQVGCAFVDIAGQPLGYLQVRLNEDSGWKTVTAEADVPEGAAQLRVNPGNYGNPADTEERIDDIVITVVERDMSKAMKVEGRTIYVDGSAKVGGDGSKGAPFNTIQAAADVAKAGDTVVIAAGVYRESVRPANSGKRNGMISYKPAEGAEVTVSGAELVDADWSPMEGKDGAFVAPITGEFESRLNQAEQLLVNGRMMIEARTPNLPFDGLDPLRPKMFHMDGKAEQHGAKPGAEVGYHITIHDAEMTAPDGTYDGALLYIWPRHGNGDQGGGWGFCTPAEVIEQTQGKLKVNLIAAKDLKHANKHHMYDGGEPYFLLMHEACLDAPGEWLRQGDELLLIPPTGVDPADATVEIKRRDYAFDLTDRSYTRIEGLKIVAATITTDHHSGNYGRGFTTDRGRKDVAPAHHIELDRLHFKYVNHFTDFTGWTMGQWVQTSGVVVSGREHKITNCLVEYTAGNGILVIGERNLVHNNIVHDTNYSGTFVGGICMGMESTNRDTIVSHNTVWASGNDGIMAQKLFSTRRDNPARIHHNRVSEFGMMTRDVGGIKQVGHDAYNGTRWDHNYVSDGGPWTLALYHDYTGNHVVDHNVAWNAEVGLNINSGRGHHVFNNTLLGYKRGITGGSGVKEKIINNLISSPYSLKFLRLKDSEVSHNVEDVTKSMFVDPQYMDWRPKEGSRAIAAGMPVAGVTPAGVAKPDVGAYQHGEALWKVGSTLPKPIEGPTELKVTRNDAGQPVLTWTDNAEGEQAYYIERALKPTPKAYWRLWKVIQRLPADSTSWTDTDIEAKVNSPHYRVRADRSMLSNTVEASRPDLVARWDFEKNLKDSATDLVTLNGEMIGGEASYSDDAKSGKHAIVFQAKEMKLVEIDDAPGLTPGDAMTVMLWIKPTRWPGGNRVVFRKGTHDEMAYGMYVHGGGFRFTVGDRTAQIDAPPAEDEWTHLTGTFDGVRARLYVNGELAGEEVGRWGNTQGVPQVDEPLLIGGPVGDASDNSYYNGLVDDLRIYADVEMTAEQIRNAMNEE